MVWPRLTVSDYPEMLRKLSAAALIVTVVCVWFLRGRIPTIDHALHHFDIESPVMLFGAFSAPTGTLIIGLIIAVFSESLKVHNKLSNLFRVRAFFDHYCILVPMALLAGSHIDSAKYERIESTRNRLMRETFYEYATSTKGAKIDTHLITQALTAWSWYWICVEAKIVLAATAATFMYFEDWQASFFVVVFILFLSLVMRFFYA